MIITAQVPTPSPVTEPGIPPANNIVKWSFNQALIEEASNAGYTSIKASVNEISVIIPVNELESFEGVAYVVTIEAVKPDELPEGTRALTDEMLKRSVVYQVSVEGKTPEDLVQISFVLPEETDPDNYHIVAVDPEDGVISYPEVSVVVTDGTTRLEGYVLNGSICFLAEK